MLETGCPAKKPTLINKIQLRVVERCCIKKSMRMQNDYYHKATI